MPSFVLRAAILAVAAGAFAPSTFANDSTAESGAPFSEERIEYTLKTGANWAGPIRDFRLTIDKGDATSLISFCGQGVNRLPKR